MFSETILTPVINYHWGESPTFTPPDTGCEYCRGESNYTIHNGVCPKIKAIEYDANGLISRVEFWPQ